MVKVEGEGCSPTTQFDCSDGSKSVRVYDSSGCCYQYKCPECIGPDALPKKLGENWTIGCYICSCTAQNMGTVVCRRRDCPHIEPPACSPERELVQVVDRDNVCCTKPQCLCKPQGCSSAVTTCPQGFELTCGKMDENQCCPVYTCTRKAVCIVDDIEYQPGVFVYTASEACSMCHCSWEPDRGTKMHSVVCEPIKCNTDCPQGYVYNILPLKCCGTCLQVDCILKTEFNTTSVIKPGDTWFPNGMNCSFYTCSRINSKPVLNLVKKNCPVVTARRCIMGSESNMDCCSKCDQALCKLKTKIITFDNYTADSIVAIGYCELQTNTDIGRPTTTTAKPACNCCEVTQRSIMTVQLTSLNGQISFHTFYHVDKCGCSSCDEELIP
ncbi:hypothetical protein NDU88_004056 [Pleurodeles waltl]|uniref:VWFC domain-containing protein n=2 Tax=Pleurodeles waltl TaxID=8319 RepID=A0AAV7TRH6_PLEWA|nr:hypothetical protein NDU88_004056 [Pleurodeles waltl]